MLALLVLVAGVTHVRGAESSVRQGPAILKPGDQGIGRQVPDLEFTDLDGKSHKLSDFGDKRAVVIALTGTGCPLCLKYAPTLAAIEQKYRDRGIAFIYVNPNQSEKEERLREAIKTHKFQGPYVQDGDKQFLQALGAHTSTEVFVLDRARTLVYRGAVDDQYGFGYALPAPRERYLAPALDAALAGNSVPTPATSAPGCALLYDEETDAEPTAITYHNRISRLVQSHCLECHRDGGSAPFALSDYAEVKDYAGMIRQVVDRGVMPPWFAAKPETKPEADEGDAPLHWLNDRSLSDTEKADLLAWIDAGAPEGDAKDAPLPRDFPSGWVIGEPDAVFEFAEPVKVKATGTMPYQHVIIDTQLPEDRWVSAIEVRPSQPQVVHHVLVIIQRPDRDKIDERDGYWGLYVPGNSTLIYPPGYARMLPKGSKLHFQMHYTPNGTATEDSTRIGIVFAKEPPKYEVRVAGIANPRIKIPAGADNHEEVANLDIPFDAQLLAFLPHMHLRGKAARYELTTDKGTETLLDVPRYDFNWQLQYRLAEPLPVRQGDKLRFTAWYDNSAGNPANPDPNKTVRWGDQTDEEMHLGYVEFIVPGATPGEPDNTTSAFFKRLDIDGDGFITREEVRERLPGDEKAAGPLFTLLDRDKNEKVDLEELSRLDSLR